MNFLPQGVSGKVLIVLFSVSSDGCGEMKSIICSYFLNTRFAPWYMWYLLVNEDKGMSNASFELHETAPNRTLAKQSTFYECCTNAVRKIPFNHKMFISIAGALTTLTEKES